MTSKDDKRPYIAFGCLAGMLAVILGAFGAHALKEPLITRGTVETWKTAVDYQIWHALALLILLHVAPRSNWRLAGTLSYCLGIVFFSGSLYWLAMGGPKWLGPITPLGGLALICGWLCMTVALLRTRQENH